ncbi:piggyBac transposable element-derived protein 4-like [Ischnura elegans]|uniref:piggyBac transposable element-derived protein 4-like n=1 Tax=Ischnura elegans TaxID=197161 RepID=UPI001ED87FDC|nr:piggyBac transposable element-derived protein 4-like [Ischnura elegans]
MDKVLFDLSNPNDISEIRRILLDDDANEDPALVEDLGEESDLDSQDEVVQREDDSATEQEEGATEDEEEEDDIRTGYFIGRDKHTKWTRKPSPAAARRIQCHNIITHLPGVRGEAKNAKTILQCWECLFSTEMLELIVESTNKYIDSVKDKFARERDAKGTDVIEIKAFIGLLYLAGAYRGNRQSLEELWGTEGDGIEKFGLAMSIKRFKFLIRCIRFDDRTSRGQRKVYDRLCPIRELFDHFVRNCRKNYIPGENVTVDEMLPGFRGRCAFRQYIPSKPSKYGIKLFALVDAKMIYTYNFEIYAGKQSEGPFSVSNRPSEVVKRFAEPLFETGRNITADNWFTDIDLINDLKKKKLSYVGTIRKNK